MFRRIWLLIWKNILLRRTNFIITGFDILLPLFLALLVVFFKIDGQGTSFNPDGSAANFRYRTESVSYFNNYKSKDLYYIIIIYLS